MIGYKRSIATLGTLVPTEIIGLNMKGYPSILQITYERIITVGSTVFCLLDRYKWLIGTKTV